MLSPVSGTKRHAADKPIGIYVEEKIRISLEQKEPKARRWQQA